MVEDVYFERIAGVGERRPERRLPKGAVSVELADVSHELPGGGEASAAPAAPAEIEIDENGFPVSPLRDQEELWFVQAANLYRPLDKGAGVARSSGLFMVLCGALTAVGGLVTVNMVTIVVGLIFVVLGTMERGAGNELSRAVASAPARLALNQALVFALIAIYCFAQIKGYDMSTAHALAEAEAQIAQLPTAEQQEVARKLVNMGPRLVMLVNGGIIGASLLFQGFMASYYLGKRRRIREFHDELPPWVSGIVKTVATR